MKINWNGWNSGGKILFVSTFFAIMSMFMNWVDIGLAASSGLSQGSFFILVFWIYPVYSLFKDKHISKLWGLVCSALSIISTLLYISSKTVQIFDKSINAAGSGSYLFLFCSIALVVAILKYQPVAPNIPS